MNVVGKFGSLISQGVYSVATPFHPFGGAVDIIVVEQQDGTYRSTPWYVRFGKFQGVLKAVKGAEKIVRISVNGVEAGFHMYLDNSGEAYFIREVVSGKDGETNGIIENSDTSKVIIRDDSKSDNTIDECNDNNVSLRQHENDNPEEVQCSEEYSSLSTEQSESGKANDGRQSYEFQDEQSSHEESVDSSGYRAYHYENLDHVEDVVESQGSDTAVVLVSVDGQILTAPISSAEQNTDYVRLNTPQFHLGPGKGVDFNGSNEELETDMGEWAANCLGDVNSSANNGASEGVLPMYNDNNTAGIISEVCTVNEELVIKSQETRNVKNLEDYPGMHHNSNEAASSIKGDEIFKSCLEPSELNAHVGHADLQDRHPPRMELEVRDEQFVVGPEAEGIQTSSGRHDDKEDCNKIVNVEPSLSNSCEGVQPDAGMGFEISLCGSLLHAGMGSGPAAEAFDECRISEQEFKASAALITKNENLIVRYRQRYLPWDKAAPIILGMAAFGLDLPVETKDVIPLEQDETTKPKEDTPEITSIPSSGRGWRLWSIPFRRVKTLQHTTSNSSNEEVFVDSESDSLNPHMEPTPASNGSIDSPKKKLLRTNVPTTDQIASLNLKEGQNMIAFNFSTSLLGRQQVDARIYVWKWNARIVISDVDGTITKSDVLGQFMPLVGRDWTQSGVARLFSAIKENGYQLLFLSARAIVQAYLTRSFLLNLKQDGKALPNGPVVISPDGLFPSLYREVIRRAPHEFKIACLEDIKALFPSDYNPFYAGFGNRDTDEFSYRKIGIPKGKIFIINPKGEVAISQSIDVKSYTSLHTLVNDMFPPTSLVEQEDFNAWNYWRVPLPNVEL